MKTKKFIIKSVSSLLVPICSFVPLVSCIEKDTQKFYDLAPQNSASNIKTLSKEEYETNDIIKKLLQTVFSNDINKINIFELEQNNPQNVANFFKEINRLKTEYKKDTSVLMEKLTALYSQNWLMVLKNLDQFTLTFNKWFVLPTHTNEKGETVAPSQQYLDKIEKTIELYEGKYRNFRYQNNYLDSLKEGEVTLSNDAVADFFISKGKSILNIKVEFNAQREAIIKFDPLVYYFAESLNTISINLLSSVFHNAIIHHVKSSYTMFENDLVEKLQYGIPALMLLDYKDKNIVENEIEEKTELEKTIEDLLDPNKGISKGSGTPLPGSDGSNTWEKWNNENEKDTNVNDNINSDSELTEQDRQNEKMILDITFPDPDEDELLDIEEQKTLWRKMPIDKRRENVAKKIAFLKETKQWPKDSDPKPSTNGEKEEKETPTPKDNAEENKPTPPASNAPATNNSRFPSWYNQRTDVDKRNEAKYWEEAGLDPNTTDPDDLEMVEDILGEWKAKTIEQWRKDLVGQLKILGVKAEQ